MKNKKKIIIVATLIGFLVAGVIVAMLLLKDKETDEINKENSANEERKEFSYIEIDEIAFNEYYKVPLKLSKAMLGKDIAYSMDYNLMLPCKNGDELERQRGLSAIVTGGLFYGYPNVTAEELGLKSDDEARLATQFAIWRLAQADGVNEAKTLEYIFDMANLNPSEGYSEYFERVKVAAKNIVDNALADPYYANPTVNIENGDSSITLLDNNEMIVGPYTICCRGYHVTDVKVSMVSAPESAILCDAEGNAKDELINLEDVYIRLSQDVGEVTFTLRLDTEGYHHAGLVYGTGIEDDMKQNFCMLDTYEDELDALMDINLPKLTGTIQVYVSDNKDTSLSGIKIKLKDTQGNELNVLETDENGIVVFDDLLVGEYVIEQVGDNGKYEIMDIPVHITVQYNVVNEVTLKNVVIEETNEK